MSENIYEELGRHLDKAVAGVPMSPKLLEILKILYPGEEAEVALKLAIYENRTLADVEAALPEKAGRLEGILDAMAHRGTVFTEEKPGRDRIYRLLPSIVGFVEVPFLDGVDTPVKRELSRLWKEYIDEGFGEEMARGMPLIRVVPIAESLQDSSQVLPFDALAAKLDEATFMAVGHCPCRQIGKYTGEGCDRPTERCMHFGSLGRYMVEMGKARELTRDEALDMLRSATEEGLVHVCDNVEGSLRTICNCCPCCCGFFRVRSQRGLATYARSNYVAVVEADDCIGCGTCEERCPVHAITLAGDVAQVDEDLCIGCGVCTPTCEGDGAILLRQREETGPPPDFERFLATRMKA
ncbi:MAG: 4Fe-4S binding protein [Actinomycetota bacterium]|nr:4Fe-4S binding protein [Actinomycetota bacterium]MDD5667064.1 4Fe-4S binding protein [Actinomycetota bacterium]